jgi:iron complex transport system substrate-binding protein
MKRASLALIAFWLLFSTSALARDVVDMRGRKVTLPDHIEKVFATSPPGTYLVYAIDPQLLVGLNFPLWDTERKHTVPRLQTLPVIGGTVGMAGPSTRRSCSRPSPTSSSRGTGTTPR